MNSPLLTVGCLILGVTLVAGCEKRSASAVAPLEQPRVGAEEIAFPAGAPQLGYLVLKSAEKRAHAVRTLNGRLAWNEELTARVYAPVSGRVEQSLAVPGQRVSPGEPLLTIRSPEFGEMQTAERKSAADLAVARRAVERARELFGHGAAAQRDVEEAEAALVHASSEHERTLAARTLHGGDATRPVDGVGLVRTPVGGVVVERVLNPGQEVRADAVEGAALFVVTDPTRLWLYLDVTELEARWLRPGQEATLHARGWPDRTFHGRVERVGEGLDPATRTVRALCSVENPEGVLRAGMYVRADLTGNESFGVEVPSEAILLRNNRPHVFVETSPGQFRRVPIELEAENEGRALVKSGLGAGQRVVVVGGLLLDALLEKEGV